MCDLLAFNYDIMDIIVSKLDKGSHLIIGLTCKEMYKILKTFNQHKKLNGTLRYLTSNLSLLKFANKNRCLMNNRTIKNIINDTNKESLECLKYAHENGCPFAEDTCNGASEKGTFRMKICS